jgi:hypothetical protein
MKRAARARRKNFLTVACKLLLYSVVACINIFRRTIFDARIGFELKEGYAITFEFATADVITRVETKGRRHAARLGRQEVPKNPNELCI